MHYRTIVLCLFLVCTLFFPIRGQKDPEDPEHADDQPFGEMTEKDLDRFLAFATSHNVDIYIESEKANHGDKDALAKIFGLASHFKKMDAVTRVYGNLIFASVLNIIESHGEKFFVSGLESHSDLVKQRVRDFAYYAVTQVPKEHRKEVEKETQQEFLLLFPPEYKFGKDNALFD